MWGDNKELRIDSKVASDDDKGKLFNILKDGLKDDAPIGKSRYEENYRFFTGKIEDFRNANYSNIIHLLKCILSHCSFLSVQATDQEGALRIFSTLNDRGMPLADADIFKAKFYGSYSPADRKDFIEKWKTLEESCREVFHTDKGTPLDEIFMHYMYVKKAEMRDNSVRVALRTFYARDHYSLLRGEQAEKTFSDLIDLANFWNLIRKQDENRFTKDTLKRLFVLHYAPNGMWRYIVSVYYMNHRTEDGKLDDPAKFLSFLDKITGFIWGYAFTNPGVSPLRQPMLKAMNDVARKEKIKFEKFSKAALEYEFEETDFSNNRPITKSMLAWWAMHFEEQTPLPFAGFHIEHILAVKRYDKSDKPVDKDKKIIESIGNKSFLEGNINCKASNHRLEDKRECYKGSKIYELNLKELFAPGKTEEDAINERAREMLNEFINFLSKNDLIEEE